MTHTAGIDVSLETSCVCIVDASGRIVRELTGESEPEALATALVDTGLVFARVGLEAGPLSQWPHAGLTRAGLPALLIETRRLRAARKTMPVKTDRNDARAIAQVVCTGWFRAVHVKSVLSQEVRGLLGARKLLVGKVRDLDNAIRALLRGFGLKVGKVGERAFAERTRDLVEGCAALEAVLTPLLGARAAFQMDDSEHDVLAYMAFPFQHRTKLHSTNPLERLNKEVKRRADVVGIFPNEASITRLIGAVLLEQNDEWLVQHRYMQIEGMAELIPSPIDADPAKLPSLAA